MSVRRMVLVLVGACAGLCMMLLFINTISYLWQDQTITGFQADHNNIPEKVTAVNAIRPASVTLPAQVAGTSLIVEELVSYDGAFMEDLSFDEVVNVAAIVLRNAGEQWIRDAEVTLAFGDARWVFRAKELPPGEAVLVLERDRNPCKQRCFTEIFGWERILETGNDQDAIHIEFREPSMLAVTNCTGNLLSDLRVYYKTVYADGIFYMGGRVYIVSLAQLLPNETAYLQPEFFAGNLSRILRVEYEIKDPPLDQRRISFIVPWKGNLSVWDSWDC